MYPQLILLLSLNFCIGTSCFGDDDDDENKPASTLSPDMHHNLIDQKDHRDDVIPSVLPVTLAKVGSEVKSPIKQRVGKKRSRLMTCEADQYAENSDEELDENGELRGNKHHKHEGLLSLISSPQLPKA